MIMLLALGCTGGTIQTSEGDDFALAFDGNSCVEIPVSAGDLPTDLTIEATVRGSVDHEPETPMPVAVLPDMPLFLSDAVILQISFDRYL